MAETTPRVPVSFTDDSKLTPALIERINEQVAELEQVGVTVQKAHLVTADEPPKYFIAFNPDHQLYKTRIALEKEGWDVGQGLGAGGRELAFYATRRVTQSKGWEV